MNARNDALIREVVAFERATRRTVEWAKWRNPKFVPAWFHHQLGRACDDFTQGCMDGAAPWWTLNAPPRHGKTEESGRAMPARAMALRPGFSVLYATSTEDRAREVSGRVRSSIVRASDFRPHLKAGRIWTVTEWETQGENAWVGVGVGNPTGGIGANMAILDDVTGSGKRARSAAFRSEVRQWVEEDVLTRLVDGGGLLVMETRRGTEDVCGWLEETYGERIARRVWRCVAEPGDTCGRKPGAYLWPERFGRAWRQSQDNLRHGGRVWSTLYQQQPHATEGDFIRREWFDKPGCRYTEPPDTIARQQGAEVVISIDTASKPGAGHDWTVAHVWARTAGTYWLLDELRGRWEITDQLPKVRALMTRWRPSTVLIEDTSNGTALIQHLRREASNIVDVSPSGRGKEERAQALAVACEAGSVRVPVGAWADAVLDEWVSFGAGAAHDDRLDASSMAIERWAGRRLAVVSRTTGIAGL